MEIKNRKILDTDILIIGGGTAGCYAALTIAEQSDAKVIIAEKANIKRSGCLAAGVNAINAYIVEGRKPEDYVDYAKKDAHGIVREDLLLTMSERLNHVTKVMEDLGLVILKDENGKYVARGNRNIKINGENMKPILAKAAAEQENVTVLNHVNITDYKTENKKVTGRSIASGTFFCPFFSLGSSVQMPGLGSLPPESKQLLHGDEFHPLLRQTVNGLQGRLHAGSVAVVQQDHIPVPRLTDGGEHLLYIPTLPVAGIHRPVQHGRAPCRQLLLGDEAVGRPDPVGPLPCQLLQNAVAAAQVRHGLTAGQAVQRRMVIGVVADLMSLCPDALHQFRIVLHLLTDEEKGGVDAPLLQAIQQSGRILGRWPVIKGQCQIHRLRRSRSRQRHAARQKQAQYQQLSFGLLRKDCL